MCTCGTVHVSMHMCWGVHRCVAWVHMCTYVCARSVDLQPAHSFPLHAVLKSSHGLKGRREAWTSDPGTGLASSLPWSSENKRPCPLLTLASIPSIRSMPPLATPGPGCLLGTSEFSLPETNVCRLHSWGAPPSLSPHLSYHQASESLCLLDGN